MGLPSKEDRSSIERTVQEIYASKERYGRVGPGRAARYEKFPLVDDELARPSASLVITSAIWHSPAKMTSRLRKRFQFYSEQKQTGIENVKFLIFLEIDTS